MLRAVAGRGVRLLRLIRASHSLLCRQSLVSAGAVSTVSAERTVIMIIRDMLEDDIEVAIKVKI